MQHVNRPVRTLMSVVFALLVPVLLFASDGCGQERMVTLDEAYRLALASHEDMGVARENISQAKAVLTKARARILPSLTAEAFYTNFSESRSSGEGIVTGAQPP